MGVLHSQVKRPVAGFFRHLSSILLLPFMNTVVIPVLILVASDGQQIPTPADQELLLAGFRIAFGSAALFGGLALVCASIGLFALRGRGTLAPWDPPRELVITGPYRWLRNPMKAGLIFVLLGEALLFRSWPLAGWFAIFTAVNVLYIRLSEEPGLRRRFGEPYASYCAAVPAWLPRLRSWRQGLGGAGV